MQRKLYVHKFNSEISKIATKSTKITKKEISYLLIGNFSVVS